MDFFKFDGFFQTRFPALPAALQTRAAAFDAAVPRTVYL
jgi:hypothetical protein